MYSRRKLYRSDILMKDFEPTFSAFKHIVSVNGLDLFFSVEEELAKASKAKQK